MTNRKPYSGEVTHDSPESALERRLMAMLQQHMREHASFAETMKLRIETIDRATAKATRTMSFLTESLPETLNEASIGALIRSESIAALWLQAVEELADTRRLSELAMRDLARHLVESGLSTVEIARAAGVSQSTISRWTSKPTSKPSD